MRILDKYTGVGNKPTCKLSDGFKQWSPLAAVKACIANASDVTEIGAIGGMVGIIDTASTDNGGFTTSVAIPTTLATTDAKYFGIKYNDYRRSLDLNSDNVALGAGSFIMAGDYVIGLYHYWTANGTADDGAAPFTYAIGDALTVWNGFICKATTFSGGATADTPTGNLSAKQIIGYVLGYETIPQMSIPALIIKLV